MDEELQPESPLKIDPTFVDEMNLSDMDDIRAQAKALKAFASATKAKRHEKRKFSELSSDEGEQEVSSNIKPKAMRRLATKKKKGVTVEEHNKKKIKVSGSGSKNTNLGTKTNKVGFAEKLRKVAKSITDEKDSLEDFQVHATDKPKPYKPSALSSLKPTWDGISNTKRKPSATISRPPTSPNLTQSSWPSDEGRDYMSDYDEVHAGKTLAVTIIDKDSQIMRKRSGGTKIVEDVPVFHSLAKIFQYVANHFFMPPLETLAPYAYPGKVGKGLPYALGPDATILDLKELQKLKKVGVDRLTVVGKSPLGIAELNQRFRASKRCKSKAGHTPVHLKSQEAPQYIISSDGSSDETEIYGCPSPKDNLWNDLAKLDGPSTQDSEVGQSEQKFPDKDLGVMGNISQTPPSSSVSSQMLADALRHTHSIASFVDHRTEIIEGLAQTTKDMKSEIQHTVVGKLDNLATATEGNATHLQDVKSEVKRLRADFEHLHEKVMEVETRTAEEIKEELSVRRTKIELIRTSSNAILVTVGEIKTSLDGMNNNKKLEGVKVAMDGVKTDIHSLKTLVKLDEVKDLIREKCGRREDGFKEVKDDVAGLKIDVAKLTADLAKISLVSESGENLNEQMTNKPVAASEGENAEERPAMKGQVKEPKKTSKRGGRVVVKPKRFDE